MHYLGCVQYMVQTLSGDSQGEGVTFFRKSSAYSMVHEVAQGWQWICVELPEVLVWEDLFYLFFLELQPWW